MVGVAPPAALSAPQPPAALETTQESPPEPRSLSPAPWERDSTVGRIEAAVAPRGDRVVRAPESTPLPAPPLSLRAKAEQSPLVRQLSIIAGAAAGIAAIITALGSAITSIISASRPASNIELEKKIEEYRSEQQGNRGMAKETEVRQAKDEEHSEDIAKLSRKVRTIEGRLKELEPKDTIQGLLPPKP